MTKLLSHRIHTVMTHAPEDEAKTDNELQLPGIVLICLLIIAMTAATWLLEYMRVVLVPFVFSLFLYYFMLPVSQLFHRHLRVPYTFSIALSILITVTAFLSVVVTFGVSINNFLAQIRSYQEVLVEVARQSIDWLNQQGFNITVESMRSELSGLAVFNWVRSISSGFISFGVNSVLVFIFVSFMLAGGRSQNESTLISHEIDQKVIRYTITKMATSMTTGVLVTVILFIVGLDLAIMFGVLAFLLNFIPNLGSIFATFLPLPIALLQFGWSWKFVLALALPGAVQFTIGNIVEPKIMGIDLDLHPVTVLVSLIFWGVVWGVAGLFLAVPLTAVLRIILTRSPSTKPIADALAGRWR